MLYTATVRFRLTVPSVAIGLYAVCFALLLPARLALPPEVTFENDAGQYNAIAENLLTKGIYSLDGVSPFFAREPGQSVFIALVYGVAGVGNRGAFFAAQGLIVLLSALFLSRRLAETFSERVSWLFLGLLLLLPSTWHVVFSYYREALSLSLAMLCCGSALALFRTRSPWWAIASGVSLGALILTYSPFLLFPPVLVGLALFFRVGWKQVALLAVSAVVVMAPWALRNMAHTGSACFTGCHRSALQWYVRGEQAETIRGLEPLRCLYAEYLSRDWTQLDENCSFNGVWHRKWPQGFFGVPADDAIAREGQQKILRYFPHYLWFSLFEILEFHIPYVNGWGRVYNVLVSVWMLVLYAGCLFALPALRRLWCPLLPFLLLLGYLLGVFVLTDATPRYHMPVVFCYALFAAIGYNGLLTRFSAWRR